MRAGKVARVAEVSQGCGGGSQQARRCARGRVVPGYACVIVAMRCDAKCELYPRPARASLHFAGRREPVKTIEDRAAIARRLLELRIEHRDLDEVIARLDAASDADDLQVRRLKKRKLRIKDQMNQLEHALIPDQPA